MNVPFACFSRKAFVFFPLLFLGFYTFAQYEVKGKIADSNGEVLPGASVMVKGAAQGTVADRDGNYAIAAPDEKAILVFSFLGYQSLEVPVGSRTEIDVKLQTASQTLEDVVVVGYGTQKKINVTGSVVSIESSQLANRGVTNVSGILAGQAPGVTILQPGGSPGRNEGTIRIRGIGTLGGDAKNNPLIIIDGIEAGSLVEVDPNDIANVSILKDAAASAIYGVRAANGVILITTKRGKEGAARVTYNLQVGRSEATMLPEKVSSYELASLYNEANRNVGGPVRFRFADLDKFADGSDPLGHPDVDQVAAVLSRPAIRQGHNLGVSGGTAETQYSIAFGYTQEGGLMLHTGLERYTFRVNLDQKLSDRLTAGLNFSGSQRNVKDPVDGVEGILHRAYREWATDLYQFPDGRWAYPTYSGLDHNSVSYLDSHGSRSTTDFRLTGTLFAEYKILEGLRLKGIVANVRDYNQNTAIQRAVELYALDPLTSSVNPFPNPSHPAVSTLIGKSNYTHTDINLQLLLNYENTFGKHYIKGLLGYNQRKETAESQAFSRRNLNPSLDQINGASSNPTDAVTSGNTIDYRLRSVFGRINYTYKDRYLLEANIRYDGTSRFPTQNRFQAFPSLSAGWRISEEEFFSPSFISGLKLRASWGKLGNQEIGNYTFIHKVDFNATSAIFGGEQVSGAAESFQLANEVIRWETTTSSNAGIDAEFLQGRLTLTADYFHKITDDILLNVEQPRILGASPPVANAGSVKNTGFEIALGYRNTVGEVRYGVNANVSKVKNEITGLGDETIRLVDGNRYEKGKSIANLYGFVAEGLFSDQADVKSHADQSALGGLSAAGDIRYKDLNGDQVIDNSDRQDLGTYFPVVSYGLSANVAWKNFDFSMLWQGVGGTRAYVTGRLARPFLLSGSPLSIQYADRARIGDDGVLINPDARFPRTLFSNSNNYTGEVADGRANSFFVKSTAFVKLRNVQLGYNVPAVLTQKLKMDKVRVFLSGENLLTISPFNYYQVDPEIPSTGDPVPSYPSVKTYLVGLNITF